jgi:peptidoglycan/xylan/chitin deacetylase (PgdA/CDA1 family)
MSPPLVLLYHAVAPLSQDADFLERALVVPRVTFARQMEDMARRGWRTLTVRQFAAALDDGSATARRFLLTFDDAYADLDRWVTPVLLRHAFTAVVFAPWAHLGQRNSWDGFHPTLSRLQIGTTDQLRALDAGPWEVESHGGRHLDLRGQDAGVRRHELDAARRALEALLGRKVRALAYPYGRHDVHVREDARAAGFELAFTARGYGPPDRFQLARRAIQSWDRTPLFRARTGAGGRWLYRLEDGAHLAIKVRHLVPTQARR